MMKYDFDSVISRYNTNSIKWNSAEQFFHVKDIWPMWIADMDFRVAQPVIDAIKRVADHGVYGYTGIGESYYEALIAWMRKRHHWDIRKEWVVLSPGVVPAIRMLIRAFAAPGDEVIVQTPAYYPFFDAIKDNGCEILDNPLRWDTNQYVMDLADLERKISPRTKMILLCSPHNPVSRVWKEDELRRLGDLCLKNDILVVSDEIHQDIVYNGIKHVPFPLVSREFTYKCVVCTAASKTFNLAGLQTSNIIISNPELRDRFRKVISSCGVQSPNMFGIVATEAAYRYGEPWLDQLLQYLQENVAFLKEYLIEKIPGVKVIEPQGTYLLWLDFRKCGVNPARLGKFVREDAKVGLEGGALFGCKEDGFERINIACPRSTLAEGLGRLERAVALLRNC